MSNIFKINQSKGSQTTQRNGSTDNATQSDSNVISMIHPYARKLKLVEVDCPYTSFQDELTQKYFSKFLAAKLKGYGSHYPEWVLPVGSYDMIAHLFLFCETLPNGELEPVMVMKSITRSRCETFRLPFEILQLFPSPETELHRRATQEIIDRTAKNNIELGYNSSWTIAKRDESNPQFGKIMKDLSVAVMANHYSQRNIKEVLIGGAVKYKVDRLQTFIGFEHMKRDGNPLPSIHCPFLFGEETAIMHLKEFSPEAKALGNLYSQMWQNRLVVGTGMTVTQPLKKAA